MASRKNSRPEIPDGRGVSPSTSAPFDQLYRDHVDVMYRFAYRLCGEAEAAKDLVQETFLNAYRAYDRFRGDAQVSTWLYAIASHACQRMRRKRKGEPERELSLTEFVPTSEGEFALQIPMEGLSPQEALENKELRAEVMAQTILVRRLEAAEGRGTVAAQGPHRGEVGVEGCIELEQRQVREAAGALTHHAGEIACFLSV